MKLMAGLVPDRSRGDWPRRASRYLAVELVTLSQAGIYADGKDRKPQTPSPRPITSGPRGLSSRRTGGSSAKIELVITLLRCQATREMSNDAGQVPVTGMDRR